MYFISDMSQIWIRAVKPKLTACFARFLYGGENCQIGKNFKADSLPRILVDKSANLRIGNDVEFRRGVELRVHGKSRVVIGDGVRIDRGVRILATNSSDVTVGSGVRIGMYSVLNGGDTITIGARSLISGFVYLQTSMHRFVDSDKPIRDQGYNHAPVTIGGGAWLASHVVVMPGVKIGVNAVVGSNAVVTHDVSESAVVGGVPAKPLSKIT